MSKKTPEQLLRDASAWCAIGIAGISAHAWEQTQQGGRIKGPMPKSIPHRYTGVASRSLVAGICSTE